MQLAKIYSRRWLTLSSQEIAKLYEMDKMVEIRKGKNGFTFDMKKTKCSCGYWQLASRLCRHVLTNIFTGHRNFCAYTKIYRHCPISSWNQALRQHIMNHSHPHMLRSEETKGREKRRSF